MDNLLQLLHQLLLLHLHFYVPAMASFPKPHDRTSASFHILFCRFLTALSLHGIEERQGLVLNQALAKGTLWLVWSSVQSTNLLHMSEKSVSLFYLLCVHWGSTFNLLQEFFLCIHNLAKLTIWHWRPSVQPFSAFDMPSH